MVREATAGDIEAMVELAARRRAAYAARQPVFWREARGARTAQAIHFRALLEGGEARAFVWSDGEGRVRGFAVAEIRQAPPVYDPGGATCLVDDLCVADDTLWDTVGRDLIQAATAWAGRAGGTVQAVVACGAHDRAKARLLGSLGYAVATEWHVRSLT